MPYKIIPRYGIGAAVWFHNRVPLAPDVPGIVLLYSRAVRRIIYLRCIYTYHVQSCCRCYCSVCCYIAAVLLQQLLLFVIVCRIAKIVAGSLTLIPSSVFFLFKHDFFLCKYPLAGLLSHLLLPRFAHVYY